MTFSLPSLPQHTIPFIDIDVTLMDNPEPRCPCVLLVDTSTSMSGAAIESLNEGVQQFERELNQDGLAKKRVEVAVVSFGLGVEVVQDFISPTSFVPPRFEANGNTPMGEAVVKAMEILEERKRAYRSAGVSFYRPWVFLITDGAPTDHQTHFWRQATDLLRDGEANKKLLFFGVGVQGADFGKLNELCPPSRPALKLQGLSFTELFSWLSSSLKSVSSANPGAASVPLLPPGWASIDV
jgi:uncharacterized protein YegL